MKNSITYICISAIFILTSCVKNSVHAPELEIEINKTNFNVGDTAAFKINGLPYNLVFYSGEIGNDYYSRNTFTATGGVTSVVFSTALASATGSSTATNLQILVSNNFTGKYNMTDVLAATWTDVTSQVAVPGLNQTINVDAHKVDNKPLYIAFRFKTVDETKSQRQITVSNFSVRTVFPIQSYTNASNVFSAGFASFDFAGDAANFWNIPVTSTTNNTFTHPLVPANSAKDDDWAISKGFSTNAINPSIGIALKGISSNPVTDYKYVFTKVGTYKVVFVASNNNINDYKEIIKEFVVTVQ